MSSRTYTPLPVVDRFKLAFANCILSLLSGRDTIVAIIGIFIGLLVEPLFPIGPILFQRDDTTQVVSEKHILGQDFSTIFNLIFFYHKHPYATFMAPSLQRVKLFFEKKTSFSRVSFCVDWQCFTLFLHRWSPLDYSLVSIRCPMALHCRQFGQPV